MLCSSPRALRFAFFALSAAGVCLAQTRPLESARWVSSTGTAIPPGSMVAGTDPDGRSPLYACRAKAPGSNNFEIGRISVSTPGCQIGVNGTVMNIPVFEVLAQYSTRWVAVNGKTLPAAAVEGGTDVRNTTEYVCRGSGKSFTGLLTGKRINSSCEVTMNSRVFNLANFEMLTYPWTTARGGATVPAGAFPAGSDIDGTTLYVCRSSLLGGVHIGKFNPNLGVCSIESFLQSIRQTSFEVLTNFSGTWGQANSNLLPTNSFDGGFQIAGASTLRQYVCRATPEQGVDTVHPGKAVPTAPGQGSMCWIEFADRGEQIGLFYEALIPNNAFVSGVQDPEPFIISHLAAGNGWVTEFVIVNTDANPAAISLIFRDGTGQPVNLEMTYRLGTEAGASINSSFARSLAPGASLTIVAGANSATLRQGWARFTSDRSVGVVTVFRLNGQEATVELTAPLSKFYLPFDNRNGFVTSMALMNSGESPLPVTVTVRDEAGLVLGSSSVVQLVAFGHTAFATGGQFPLAAGKRGLLEFTAPIASMSGLGLRFSPANAFTSFPVQVR